MPAQVNAVDAAGADYGKAIQSKKKKPTFECPHCSRKFATRSHLVRHSRVHTGERRYACDYPGCEMRCSRKDNLQQHYRTHLVVNPRRANAQSMLSAGAASGTTATAGGSHEAANDPEAQEVSIHRHNINNNNNGAGEYTSDPTRLMGSPTDLKPIPSDPSQPPLDNHHNHNHNHGLGAHLQTASHLDVAHHHDPTSAGANPDRDWSLSPPPPLSSAYDYWYAHGCLPHTVRNPASVSGSGSSGATSPELSNALELAPGQGGQQQQHAHHSHSHPHSHHHHPAPPHHPHHAPPPHHHSHMHPTHHHHHPQQPGPPQHHLPPVHTAHHPHPHPHQQQQQQQQQRHSYVESPTGYYHSHHNMPNTAGGYSSYDGGEGGAATMRTSFSLGTATFPSPADYHHPAAPPPPTTAAHHGHPHHSHHQRSNSYSRMGGGGGYESATTSPHISNAHLHHAPHSGLPAPPTRHHSYPNGTDSYAVAAAAAAASYHNSPTEYKFHPPPQQQHVYPGPSSVSGNESRPVTRHGSMTATATTSGYTTVPVYPSHPHATAQTTMGYGVAAAAGLDMTGSSGAAAAAASSSHGPQATNASAAAAEQQQQQQSASGANSPRGSSLPPPPLGSSLATASQSGSGSLVLPPIRYSDGVETTTNTNGETTPTASTSSVSASASAYGMMGLGGPSGHGHGHFTSATPQNGWERVSISDARALPPHPSAMTR